MCVRDREPASVGRAPPELARWNPEWESQLLLFDAGRGLWEKRWGNKRDRGEQAALHDGESALTFCSSLNYSIAGTRDLPKMDVSHRMPWSFPARSTRLGVIRQKRQDEDCPLKAAVTNCLADLLNLRVPLSQLLVKSPTHQRPLLGERYLVQYMGKPLGMVSSPVGGSLIGQPASLCAGRGRHLPGLRHFSRGANGAGRLLRAPSQLNLGCGQVSRFAPVPHAQDCNSNRSSLPYSVLLLFNPHYL